eukprot:2463126-Rhodomonas_salina.1
MHTLRNQRRKSACPAQFVPEKRVLLFDFAVDFPLSSFSVTFTLTLQLRVYVILYLLTPSRRDSGPRSSESSI